MWVTRRAGVEYGLPPCVFDQVGRTRTHLIAGWPTEIQARRGELRISKIHNILPTPTPLNKCTTVA